MYHNVPQRSLEWFKLRQGRLTSSRIDELLSNGRKKGEIGQMFYTYIYEVVEEEIFGEEDPYDSPDMQRGRDLEPIAFNIIKDKYALDFISVTEGGYFTLGHHEGSSPDVLIGDDTIGEIKAPRRRKFFDIVRNGISAVDKKWQTQIQHQMRCSGRTKGLFIFIYVTPNGEPLLHTIEVEIDPEVQELLEERIAMAIEEKEQYKQYLIEKSWN